MLPWKIKVLENIKTERERDREGQKKEGGRDEKKKKQKPPTLEKQVCSVKMKALKEK